MTALYNPADRSHIIARTLVETAFQHGQVKLPCQSREHQFRVSQTVGKIIQNWRDGARFGNTLGEPSLSALCLQISVKAKSEAGVYWLEVSRRGYDQLWKELARVMPSELTAVVNRLEAKMNGELVSTIEERAAAPEVDFSVSGSEAKDAMQYLQVLADSGSDLVDDNLSLDSLDLTLLEGE